MITKDHKNQDDDDGQAIYDDDDNDFHDDDHDNNGGLGMLLPNVDLLAEKGRKWNTKVA